MFKLKDPKPSLEEVLECVQTDLGKAEIIRNWGNQNEISNGRVNHTIDVYLASKQFYSAQNLAQKYNLTNRVIESKKLDAKEHIEKNEFSWAAKILEGIDPDLTLDLWEKSFNQIQDKIKKLKSNGKEVPKEYSEQLCISAYHLGDENSVLNSGIKGTRTCGGNSARDYVFNIQEKKGMWKEVFRDNFTHQNLYCISQSIQEAKTPEQIKDCLRNSLLGLLANKAGDESRQKYVSYVAGNLADHMEFDNFEFAIDEDIKGHALKSYLESLRNPADRVKNKSFNKLFDYGLVKEALEIMDKSGGLEGVCGFSIEDITKLNKKYQSSIKEILVEYLLDKIKEKGNSELFSEDSYALRAIEASIYSEKTHLAEEIFNKEYADSNLYPAIIANAAKAAGLREPEVRYANIAVIDKDSSGDFEDALYLCKEFGLNNLIPKYEKIISALKNK